MQRLFVCTALSLIVLLAACTPPASQNSSDLAARSEAWEAAFNRGDAAALAAMYTEDSRVLPPNGELEQGRDAVEATFGEMTAAGLKGKIDTLEAVVAGDIGYKIGRYSIQSPDGAEIDRGKYIETWKRVDGTWQISNDIWNSDLPSDAQEATLFVTHGVKDLDHWLAAWSGENSRHEFFAKHGVDHVRVFRNPDDPTVAGLLIGVPDVETFQALTVLPETRTAMVEDGVKASTLRMFTEVR